MTSVGRRIVSQGRLASGWESGTLRVVVPDLSSPLRVHVVGAGGAAMSAIGEILLAMGHSVTGSDAVPSAALDRLGARGARTWVGHDPVAASGCDLVAVS